MDVTSAAPDVLTLTLSAAAAPGSYDVELQIGERVLTGELDLADLPVTPPDDALVGAALGRTLAARLFAGRFGAALLGARAAALAEQRQLRVRLDLLGDDARLHALPWELLAIDDGSGIALPLALDPTLLLSRGVGPLVQLPPPPRSQRPLTLCTLAADDAAAARWNLRSAQPAPASQLVARVVVEPAALAAALSAGPPELPERGYDLLLLVGLTLPPDELLALLSGLLPTRRPALVLLVLDDAPSEGALLAARLLRRAGLLAAIVFDGRTPDADHAWAGLLRALLAGVAVDLAVAELRQKLGVPNEATWHMPLLALRPLDGTLFAVPPQLKLAQRQLADPALKSAAVPGVPLPRVVRLPANTNWRGLRYLADSLPPAVDALAALLPDPRLASIAPLVLVVGQPEAGRDALMRRFVMELARRALEDWTTPVALLVPLEGYRSLDGRTNLSELVAAAAQSEPALEAIVRAALLFRDEPTQSRQEVEQPVLPFQGAAGRFVFVLEDLERVQPELRPPLAAEIQTLLLSAQQRVVLSSGEDVRSSGLLDEAETLVVQPADLQQLAALLAQRDPTRAGAWLARVVGSGALGLNARPTLLAATLARVADSASDEQAANINRAELLGVLLDERLNTLAPRFRQGDTARNALNELAWQMQTSGLETIALDAAYALLAQARGQRDYRVDDLLDQLLAAGLLVLDGWSRLRFADRTLAASCAAVALAKRPNMLEQLAEIAARCGVEAQLAWWQETVYALLGMGDAAPALRVIAAAARSDAGAQGVLLARSMAAVQPRVLAVVDQELELFDRCALRADPAHEPEWRRRAAIVEALGHCANWWAWPTLVGALVGPPGLYGAPDPVSDVRLAAAGALLTLLVLREPEQPVSPRKGGSLKQGKPPPTLLPSALTTIAALWQRGLGGEDEAARAELTTLLQRGRDPLTRTLAAHALARLVGTPTARLRTVRQLLRTALSTRNSQLGEAAADALASCDPGYVGALLGVLVERRRTLPAVAGLRLAVLARRMSIGEGRVVAWLQRQLERGASLGLRVAAGRALARLHPNIEQARSPSAAPLDQLEALVTGTPTPLLHRLAPPPAELMRAQMAALEELGLAGRLGKLAAQVGSWPLELRLAFYRARLLGEEQA